jgi:hypothetical protein
MKNTLRYVTSVLIAGGMSLTLLAGPLARPAAADDIGSTIIKAVGGSNSRQGEKNAYRNIGIGLGAAAAYEAINGRGTHALILGAGAAYSAKKYEDARKAQNRENSYQNASWYRNEYRRETYRHKHHHGHAYGHYKHHGDRDHDGD